MYIPGTYKIPQVVNSTEETKVVYIKGENKGEKKTGSLDTTPGATKDTEPPSLLKPIIYSAAAVAAITLFI